MSIERASQAECPDIIRVHARDAESLIELAEREGVLCQLDSADGFAFPPAVGLML